MIAWYVATCHHKAEPIARMHLSNQGYETFLPVRPIRQPTGGLALRPLIPGYIFVALDLHCDGWKSVNATRGVRRLLPLHSEIPEPVPQRMMDTFRETADGIFEEPEAVDRILFDAGQELRIVDGGFSGMLGHVVADDGKRIRLLLTLFGRRTRATVERRQVERVALAV